MRRDLRSLTSARSGSLLLALVLSAVAAAACNVLSIQEPPRAPDAFDKVRAMDLLPRVNTPAADAGDSRRGDGARAVSFYGNATSPAAPGAQPAGAGEGYELNFENTPITTVAKVILGDILATGYTIDPRVQGTVTLASGRPVPKSDILYVLESALKVSNVALVREARGYRLTPGSEAIGSGSVDSAGNLEPGYGITVIPLQYVSAAALMKLLDSFATKQGTVRADPGRNLVVVQGSGAERRAAVETVLSFDADWMRGQSVGIYPVRNSTPEPVISELERIMDAGEGGLSQNLVKLQAIGRQNAILVVARKPELLKTVATWISRLDNSDAVSTGVKVYRVRYGDARQLATLLNDMFIGRGGGSFESAANQIAPGAGIAVASSAPVGFGGAGGGGAVAAVQPVVPVTSSRQQSAAAATGADARYVDAGGSLSPGLGGGAVAALGRGGSGGGAGGLGILPGVRITPDVVNNSLLIYANQEHYRIIERTLNQLDRPQAQVAIEATIAEITLNDSLNYGVQFFLKSKDLGLGPDKGSIVNTAASSLPLARVLPGFNFLAGSEADPKVILDALHSVTDVKVLSSPSVVVIDNQVATLQVGDQIPVVTRTAQAVDVPTAPAVNSIDYRNTGIILRVVPRVSSNGNVQLDIEQEISSVAKGSNANTLTPTVSQRKVKSSISVATGQTVLLAGLITEQQDRDRRGVPVLDQVPGLGELFTRNSGNVSRTELILFIRPQIIRDSVDAARVAEELRGKMRGQVGVATPLVPREPRAPRTVP